MKKGKRYVSATQTVDRNKVYSLAEAFVLVKENAKAKFDEAIEVHIRLNIDAKKGDQAVRSSVSLPHGTGKTLKVGVITESKVDEAKEAGADVVGGQELIDSIKAGNLPEVDVLVATPDMMIKLASAARILGPRGLMPSPKTETVTNDVAKIIGELKKGKENFKNDNTGNVHQVIGKASFEIDKLVDNFKALIEAVGKCKGESHKGKLIANISICSTMGPSVKIQL
jgi:large subunit ribosomal protein L1